MKKLIIPFIYTLLIFSCTTKKTRIDYVCEITSCKEEPKISIHDQMNSRTRYTVSTSCDNRKFTVYRKYNIGDTVKLTEIVIAN